MDQFSHNPLNAANAEELGGRAGGRDSLLLTAQFRVGGGEAVSVRVRNLSAGGLMAEYGSALDSGTPVEVEVRGVGWVSGKIAWSAEGRVGVAFDRDIDTMLARKPVGKGPGTPHFVKPILGRR